MGRGCTHRFTLSYVGIVHASDLFCKCAVDTEEKAGIRVWYVSSIRESTYVASFLSPRSKRAGEDHTTYVIVLFRSVDEGDDDVLLTAPHLPGLDMSGRSALIAHGDEYPRILGLRNYFVIWWVEGT